MRAALIGLAALAAALWGGWAVLAERVRGGEDAAALSLVLLAVAAPLAGRLRRSERLSPLPLRSLALLLALYVAAALAGPPIARMAVAVIALLWSIHRIGRGAQPPLALFGLGLLALPVLPTLEFYLAFPLRLASAGLTAALLRANGLAVVVDGVALDWGGRLVQLDAPCSGVHMLWASLYLASAIAFLDRSGPRRYALTLAVSAALAIAGNAVRAASLFYVESGIVALGAPEAAHDAIGLVAFALTALVYLALMARRPWGTA